MHLNSHLPTKRKQFLIALQQRLRSGQCQVPKSANLCGLRSCQIREVFSKMQTVQKCFQTHFAPLVPVLSGESSRTLPWMTSLPSMTSEAGEVKSKHEHWKFISFNSLQDFLPITSVMGIPTGYKQSSCL